jgi:hypothetical protein
MFSEFVSQWQLFFATVAGITATLMGLIFLSLSLKLDIIRKSNDKGTLQIAWQTFVNFFFLIMFALVFLVPEQTAAGLVLPLLIISLVAIAITISQALRTFRIGINLTKILIESVPSLVAFIGMIIVIGLLYYDNVQSLVWLLPIVIILLAVAVRNAWNLLVR